jgi:isopentenyl diphosphate isomerase/L-lactate dehydrogenase-like FMN-dependent dehydrogenase
VSARRFETIAMAERCAKRRLPASVYAALVAGQEKGRTLRENLVAFDELELSPCTAGQPERRGLESTVMGPASVPARDHLAGGRPSGAPRG